MEASDPIPLGRLEVPSAWSQRIELRCIAPETTPAGLPTTAGTTSLPPSIQLSRHARDRSIEDSVKLLTELNAHRAGFEASPPETVHFADGATGQMVAFRFTEGTLSLRQRHIFRKDGGILTQLTATASALDQKHLDEDILPVLLSFRLDA